MAITDIKTMAAAAERIGDEGKECFMQAGIAGMSPSKLDDVKCLHAHLADHLLRPGSNAIGAAVEEALVARGVDVSGCGECRQQCDWGSRETPDTWRYVPQKNRIRLRQRKDRRRKTKKNMAVAAAGTTDHAPAADAVASVAGRGGSGGDDEAASRRR